MLKTFKSGKEIEIYIKDIHGDFSGDDMEVLRDHIGKLQPGEAYLEIGVYYGKSAACAVFSAQEGVKIFLCDIEDHLAHPDPHATISRKDFFEREGLDTKAVFMVGNSVRVAEAWKNIGIEFSLIFIDGNHLYEPVKQDILGWQPYLKSGGHFLFHDYMGGVQQAVDELIKNSPDYTDFFVAMEKYEIQSSSLAGARKK